MENVLEQLAERKTVVAVSAGIDRAGLLASPIYPDEYDPHIWFDVTLWMQAVEQVRDTLIEYDPEHAADYEANAAAYLIELQSLHEYVQEQAQRVPESQRVLITAHDAFNYFGRAYSFEVLGVQGISTASEASTADVQELADFIATRQIPAVFVESSVPVRTIEAVQAAVQAKQGFSKVVKVTSVAAISNRAFSGGIRARLGNRGYIRDFGKTLPGQRVRCANWWSALL